MRTVLKNTAETKEYLDSLPKIYAVFMWAKWAVLECAHVPGAYDEYGLPLVYNYYDFNGEYDEYRLVSVDRVSSGAFYSWYVDKDQAEYIRDELNKENL